MLIHKVEFRFASDDRVANFLDTTGTKAIGLAGESERRRNSLVGFQQRTGAQLGRNGFTWEIVDSQLKSFPGYIRKT